MACRPWSLPASIVPVALAGCLVHRDSQTNLLTPNFVGAAVMVLSVHAAGNLLNTYFDFKAGVDKKEVTPWLNLYRLLCFAILTITFLVYY
jgi:1,4-dihydroxy-2-naphthoate octaprenyltransferase